MPVQQWLTADDYLAALAAAGAEVSPAITALEDTLSRAATAIDVALRSLRLPEPMSLLSVAAELRAIGKRGRAALDRLIPDLADSLADSEPRPFVIRSLENCQSTAVIALVGAAAAEVGLDAAAAAVADAIISRSSLRAWAEAARAQYEAGAKRERGSRLTLPDPRSLAPTIGFALIDTFVVLTGRRPTYSRIKPEPRVISGTSTGATSSRAGHPSGPLIRYLEELYRRLTAHIAQNYATRGLQDERIWSPSAETLVSWIDAHRQSQGVSAT